MANGDTVVVRYADDFVVGLQHKSDAERLLQDLRERLARFGLELHTTQDPPAGVRQVRQGEPEGPAARET